MQLKLLAVVLYLGCVLISVEGQVPFLGSCPDRPVVENFETDKYLGRWYEAEKYFALFETGAMCVQTYYSPKENGTIGVMNSQIQQKNGKMRSFQGTARPIEDSGAAKFLVSFDSISFIGDAPYFVLDTDYKTYSLVWSCTDYAVLNFQILWFLTREQYPSPDIIMSVHDKMDAIGLRRDLLRPTNQTNCAT